MGNCGKNREFDSSRVYEWDNNKLPQSISVDKIVPGEYKINNQNVKKETLTLKYQVHI